MGLGGISVWQLLIVLVIVLLIFGPSRLKNIGSQLGTAIKDFRKTVKENEESAPQQKLEDDTNTAKEKAESKEKESSTS